MVYGIIVLELAWFISLSWMIFILKQYVLCLSFFWTRFFALMFWTSRVLQLGLLPFEFPWVFLLFELFSKLIWDVMFEHTTFVVVNLSFFLFIKLLFFLRTFTGTICFCKFIVPWVRIDAIFNFNFMVLMVLESLYFLKNNHSMFF